MRRGKTRLQGYYGGDFLFWMTGAKTTYDYGNALDGVNNTDASASSNNFGGNIIGVGPGSGRVTENKSGSTLGIGLFGFIGAEYFILPKISVGAEYSWGVSFSTTGEGEVTTESVGGVGPVVGKITTKTAGGSSFGIDNSINGNGSGTGSLRIMFHF